MFIRNNISDLIKKQFYFDISNLSKLKKTINQIKPDYIFFSAFVWFINLIKNQ